MRRPSPAVAAAFLAAAALAAPAARAQSAETAWNAAYRLVLARDWGAARTALDAFVAAYPADGNAVRARFWRCYVDEQTGRLADATACYDALARTETGRWADEARTRRLAVEARQGTLVRDRVQTTTVTGEDGTSRTVVVLRNADGTRDTLAAGAVVLGADFPPMPPMPPMPPGVGAPGFAAEALRRQRDAVHRQAEEVRDRADRLRSAATDATRRSVEQQAEALERQADGLERQADAIERQMDALERQAGAVERQADAAAWASGRRTVVVNGQTIQTCAGDNCSTVVVGTNGWGVSRDTMPRAERVAVLAVEALARQGNSALPDLRSLAESGTTPAIRVTALDALSRLGTPEADRLVVDLARRQNALAADDYERLVIALGRVAERQPEAVRELERIARFPNLAVGAVQRLSRSRSEAATQALVRLAEDTSLPGTKRVAAMGYLLDRGDPRLAERAATLLDQATRSPNEDLSGGAVSHLLRLAAGRSDAATAGIARRALRRLVDDAAAPSGVRAAAVQGLVSAPDAETVPTLVRLARTGPDELAEAAVRALARLDSPEARRALLDLARTPR